MDIGLISFYFVLKIGRDRKRKTIKLSQPVYIDKILAKLYLFQVNMSNTFMKECLLESKKKEAIVVEQERYQRMTGLIIFFMVETRPDIAFATSIVSQCAKNLS